MWAGALFAPTRTRAGRRLSICHVGQGGMVGGKEREYPENRLHGIFASCSGSLTSRPMDGLIFDTPAFAELDLAFQVPIDLVVLALQLVEGALHDLQLLALVRVLVLDGCAHTRAWEAPGPEKVRERAGAETVEPVEVVIEILMLFERQDGHFRVFSLHGSSQAPQWILNLLDSATERPPAIARMLRASWSTQDQTSSDSVSYLRPRQDSNLRSRLRRAVLYPLSYGGRAWAEEECTSARGPILLA